MPKPIRLGTRGSALALIQSRWVATQLEQCGITVALEIIRTTGDHISERAFTPGDGKGVFVAELEQALLDGHIDLAVHSMKDLPGEMTAELTLAAIPAREDPRDVLVFGDGSPTLAALPAGATIGTSSARRRAQLLATRPDIRIADMRGNIDTRVRKLDEGQYHAICLAAAGLHRLGIAARITQYLDYETMLPAVGQGALAIQTRADDYALIALCAGLHDETTARAVRAERTVLVALGGGCSIPLGVLATIEGDIITIMAALSNADGSQMVRERLSGRYLPEEIGRAMADILRDRAGEMGIMLSEP